MSGREAGRELDAEVAEKVFGAPATVTLYAWADRKKREHPRLRVPDFPDAFKLKFGIDCGSYVREDGTKFTGCCRTIPHYSTDIAAAWEVVEKLHKHFDTVTVSLRLDGITVDIGDAEATMPIVHAYDDYRSSTVPLVVCRAALAALTPTGENQ